MTMTQLSVFLGSDRAALPLMAQVLADAGINIYAASISYESTYGIARILVDVPDRARESLGRAGLTVNAADVIAVRVPNRPGVLASISRVLAEAQIPVDYLYGTFAPAASEVAIVIRTSLMAEALSALSAHGTRTLTAADLGD